MTVSPEQSEAALDAPPADGARRALTGDRLKRWLWTLLRVGFTVGAMAFVLSRVDLGETLARMRHAHAGYFVLVLAVLQVGMVGRAWRWRFLLAAHGIHAPLRRLTELSYVGEFFGQFLPTAFGGDVVRILAFGEARSQVVAATAILDRMMGLFVLFAMALVLLPFSGGVLPAEIVTFTAAVAGVGLLGGLVLLDGRLVRRGIGWLPGPLSLRGAGWLAQTYDTFTSTGRRALGAAALISLAYNAGLVVNNYLVGRAYGVDYVPLELYAVFVPAVVTSYLLPSIQGWGVAQGVYVPLLMSVGVPAETALAISVTVALSDVVTGLLGGVVFVLPTRRLLGVRPPSEKA